MSPEEKRIFNDIKLSDSLFMFLHKNNPVGKR